MSKILVVTYSFTGTGTRLTELLCRSRDWTSARIVEPAGRGRLPTLRCAIESLLRLRPGIVYEGPDPRDFELVVLVAPTWLLQLASPMRSFVARYRHSLSKQVAVISLMGGQGGQNAPAEIGRILGRPPLMSTTFTMREVEDGSYAGRLLAFAAALEGSCAADATLRPLELSPEAAG